MARAATTIGLHGRTLLGLIYRYGALTRSQLVRLTGLHPSAVDRQLRHLRNAGYVDRIRDVASWQTTNENAHTGYYLTVPAGAKIAAFELGIENDVLSLRHYRRVRLPGTISHRIIGNEYLMAVAGAAGDRGLEAGETYSESCPDFPLFGAGVPKTDRADTKYRFSRIVPDGTFTMDNNRYCLEVETGTVARAELVGKLNDYAGRWRRLLKPNSGERKYHDADARPEPLIVLTPTNEHKPMRDYLRKHLPDAPDWNEADSLIKTVSGNRAEAGQLIIVAGLDEVRDDPLKRNYRPLYRYPEDISDPSPSGVPGWRVSLRDAAAISQRIHVPRKAKGAA